MHTFQNTKDVSKNGKEVILLMLLRNESGLLARVESPFM